MSLLLFFEWCEKSPLAEAMRSVPWRFPLVEIFHLAGMVVLLGTVLIVDLRLLGVVLRRQPAWEVAGDLAPWGWAGLGAQLVTGPLLFLAEATKRYQSPSFRFKMALLAVAIVFHFTIYRKASTSRDAARGPLRGRLTACLSLALWFGVVLAGLLVAA